MMVRIDDGGGLCPRLLKRSQASSSSTHQKRRRTLFSHMYSKTAFMIIGVLLMLDGARAQDEEMVPNTVILDDYAINAVTKMTITGFLKGPTDFKLTLGDCFKISVKNPYVESATEYTGSNFYASFPNTAAQSLSSSSPAATFEKDGGTSTTDVIVRITDASNSLTDFKFVIDGFVNPYSQVRIQDGITMRHYVGCANTPTTQGDPNALVPSASFQQLKVPDASDQETPTAVITPKTGSANVLGSQDGDITFKFKAGTSFPKYGGTITLGLPNWYSDGNYVFNNGAQITTCVSSELSISTQKLVNQNYVMKFTNFGGSSSDTVTIKCSNYNNPVYQQTLRGFTLDVKDNENIGNNIMKYPTWTLDATTLQPAKLATDIAFSFQDPVSNVALTSVAIQTETSLFIEFRMPVPVEKTGCFLKIIFPNDFQLVGNYIYQGFSIMRDQPLEASDPFATKTGYSKQYPDNVPFSKGNYVIFEGCNRLDGKDMTAKISMKGVQTPKADKTTNDFIIQMFKEQSESDPYTLSNPIFEAKTGKIDASIFTSGVMTDSNFGGNIYFIQMTATHTLEFKIKNSLPVKDTQFDSRIVIKMPIIMQKASDTPSVRNMDGKFLGAKVAREKDASLGCDARICYALTHTLIGDIPGGTTLIFRITGTFNQESVQTAGTWEVITQITDLVATDGVYKSYNIDQGTFSSGFTTVKGGISATSGKDMKTSDPTTYIESSTYTLYFTLNNYIPLGGKLILVIPDEVSFVSNPTSGFKAEVADASGTYTPYKELRASGVYTSNSMDMQVSVEMPAGDYAINFPGTRNARSFEPTGVFSMTSKDLNNNLVGDGPLDNIRMTKPGAFTDLKIEVSTAMNGAQADYTVTFKPTIPVADGDIFYLGFPKTIKAPKEPVCEIKTCLTAVTCNSEKGRIVAQLDLSGSSLPSKCKNVGAEISFVIKDVINAPTMIKSDALTSSIFTKNYQQVAEYRLDDPTQLTTVTNLDYGVLKGITIDQANKDFGVYNQYTIRFTPINPLPQIAWIKLNFPTTVGIDDNTAKFVASCTATTTSSFTGSDYCKIEQGNKFQSNVIWFYNIFLEQDSFTSEIALSFYMKNPSNNFEEDTDKMTNTKRVQYLYNQAFHIETFTFDLDYYKAVRDAGFDATTSSKFVETVFRDKPDKMKKGIDAHLADDLKPKLKCNAPCYTCLESDPNWCQSCWGKQGGTKYKDYFLQATPTSSTCQRACDDGFTTNGDQVIPKSLANPKQADPEMAYYKCTECQTECGTCKGQGLEDPDKRGKYDYGEKGDKEKCIHCSAAFNFIVKTEKTCMTMCTAGYYQQRIGSWGAPKNSKINKSWYGECVKCNLPCSQCKKCDIKNDKTCVKCPKADNAKGLKERKSAFNKCLRDAKKNDPSPNYCLACDQSKFFPKLLIDIQNVKEYVLTQRGMTDNKAYTMEMMVKELKKSGSTFGNQLAYEQKLLEFDGDAQNPLTLQDFLDTKIVDTKKSTVFRSDLGMKIPDSYCPKDKDPKDCKPFEIKPDFTTYAMLFEAQYSVFGFPEQSLYKNKCLKFCPQGFASVNGICLPCKSPCKNCRNEQTKCTSCLQTKNNLLRYVYGSSCYETCPKSTVKDEENKRCKGCQAGCLKCSEKNQKICLECDSNLYLHKDRCFPQCPDKFRPSFDGKRCEPEGELPVIFFPLGILCLLAGAIAFGGQFSSKNVFGLHRKLLSFYAMVGVIDCLSMWACVILTVFQGQYWQLAIPLLALAFNYFLNYKQIQLWDIIDPEKPEDEEKLDREEVLAINECDKNFDEWNTKYYGVGRIVYLVIKFGSHKFFSMPFTHFFGYQHFTMRTQDYYHSWQWASEEIIKYNQRKYSLKQISDPKFKFKGKLVPKAQEGNYISELLDDQGNLQGYEGGEFDKSIKTSEHHYPNNQVHDEDDEMTNEQIMRIYNPDYQPEEQQVEEAQEMSQEVEEFEGGGEPEKKFNPFHYVQHPKEEPKKDEHMVPDTRVPDLFNFQIKVDFAGIRTVNIIGNSVLLALWLMPGEDNGNFKHQMDQQMMQSIECIIISLLMIILQILIKRDWEEHRLPFKMKDAKSNFIFKAKKLPNQTKDFGEEQDGILPEWNKYMHYYKFNEIFLDNKLEELLNIFGRRQCKSCIELPTGTEIEEDPRRVRSFPLSPKGEKLYQGMAGDFDLIDFQLQDNVYAEVQAPTHMFESVARDFSDFGAQVFAFDVLEALNRKGGDLLTPGIDDDYARKNKSKKKRGRKNKYYKQIDQEDDEEAKNLSDDSDNDGLDHVKEEDEEDEEEEMMRKKKEQDAKLAAETAERKKKKEAEEKRLQLEDEKRLLAEEEAKKKAAADKKRKDKEAKDKALKDEEDRIAREHAEKLKREAEEAERLRQQQLKDDDALKKDIEKNHSPKKSAPPKAPSQSSSVQVNEDGVKNFNKGEVIEVPPNAESRRFNECDIIGNLDRDEKGNVIAGDADSQGGFKDKKGQATNQRGYLVDPKTGDVVNNLDGTKMFDKKELDDRGEVPAPFNVEKHNFNPHQVRGDFDYDKNGKPIIKKDAQGAFVDKRGSRVSSRGYRMDSAENMQDNYGRPKFHKNQMTEDGDLPKLFNYNGRRFDITDSIGIMDKDENGNVIPQSDANGRLVDKLGRPINSRGYLIDEFGNVIDKDGRQIFEKKHLESEEIPKIFPFTKFNVKNVLGDFEMDPLGNPILDRDNDGNLIDRQGRRVNSKGYLIDKDGNVINKHGKVMFKKDLLDNEGDVPKVFRTGLLKSDTASSLSRLMSEIERNQPSEFDQEERRIQQEIENQMKGGRPKRGNSGNTSVDSMMEDTPANYNDQNMRFDPEMEQQDEMEDDDDEYGSQMDDMGLTGMTGGGRGKYGQNETGYDLATKKRKKKKKKKKKKPVEMEDPSLREHLMAGAYGGIAKSKPKRQGVKYTTNLDAGLRDIATPASGFMRDPSRKNMQASYSGFANIKGGRVRSSQGRSELGSQIGSKISKNRGLDATSKLLDPQQREDQLKKQEMDKLRRRQIAKAKEMKAAGKIGKISKDADFEKMFGKDIDEFLEDSEWDIESIDKMSQFSKGSKNTIRSAAQAGKLRGLEKLYLQRIETSMNKNTLQMTGDPTGQQKGEKKKKGKFRADDDTQSVNSRGGPKQGNSRKKAWDTGSRASSKGGNQSMSRVFQGK